WAMWVRWLPSLRGWFDEGAGLVDLHGPQPADRLFAGPDCPFEQDEALLGSAEPVRCFVVHVHEFPTIGAERTQYSDKSFSGGERPDACYCVLPTCPVERWQRSCRCGRWECSGWGCSDWCAADSAMGACG